MAKGNLSKTYHGKGRADEKTLEKIKLHLAARDNPHGVTAEGIGAIKKSEVEVYVLGLSNRISEVDSKYNTETSNIRASTQQALTVFRKDIDGKSEANHRHTSSEVGAYTTTEADMLMYSVPSSGLDIQNGIVMGIGTCRDENIIIPEIDGDGNVVYKVDNFVFSSLLGSDGGFIKRIIFPSSIRALGTNVLSSEYCPNLCAVFLMNPDIKWQANQVFMLGENVKDVYLGFSRKKWIELNTIDNEYPLISLNDDNIAAGIMPVIHYSHFATSAVFEKVVGNIDTALDELHSYAQALISGGDA